jgi:hypothetical protein
MTANVVARPKAVAIQGGLLKTLKRPKFSTQEFMLKDLVGERNVFWQGTPLFILYKKCNNKGNPVFLAGQIAEKNLKNVLINDKRTFKVRKDPSSQKNIYS